MDSPEPTTGWSRREDHDSWDEEDADDDADEGEKVVVVEVAEDVVFSAVLTNGSDGGDRRGLRVLSPNVLGDVRARGARISRPRSAASSDMPATSFQDWLCDIFRGMLTGGGGNACWLVGGGGGGGFFPSRSAMGSYRVKSVRRPAQRIRRAVPMHVPCDVRVLR